uniref:LIM domain only protein 3-like isoform X3 n=1 Tax=Myxine glutinosa TaxID=7769 RepID=UPI00358FCB0E
MAVRQCVSAARSALFGAQRRRLGASHRRSAARSLRDSRSCAAGTSRISHGRTLCSFSPKAACDARHGRLFGVTGNCAACSKLIPAFEMVMRVRESVYHLDCFACQLCSQRFCVGDKFFLKNNMILCQSDYEETSAKETFPSPVPT